MRQQKLYFNKSYIKQLNDSDLWTFYQIQEQYISKQIALADAKAGVIFLASSGVIGFLLQTNELKRLFENKSSLTFFQWNSIDWSLTFLLISLFILLLNAFCCGLVVYPRTPSGKNDQNKKSIIFWFDISQTNKSDSYNYVDLVKNSSKKQISEDMLTNLYALSTVVNKKIKRIRFALQLLFISIFFSFLHFIILLL